MALAASLAAGFAPGLFHLVERLPASVAATGFLALALAGEGVAAPALAGPLRAVGGLGALVCLLTLSYRDLWENELRNLRGEAQWSALGGFELALAAVLLLAALLAGLRRRSPSAGGRASRGREEGVWIGGWWIAGVAAVWLALDVAVLAGEAGAMLLVNLYLLGLGLAQAVAGFRDDDLRRVNAAMALVALVVALRFFDSELDFLMRGLAFILLGLAFFLLNAVLLYRRSRRPAAAEGPDGGAGGGAEVGGAGSVGESGGG
jgi:hypothetical protein